MGVTPALKDLMLAAADLLEKLVEGYSSAGDDARGMADRLREEVQSKDPPEKEYPKISVPENDGDLFSWENKYVRGSDPETSHEAAAELDERKSSFEAFTYFKAMAGPEGVTATEYEQYIEMCLMKDGWDEDRAHRRAESLRRRLTDLQQKYRKIEVSRDVFGGGVSKRNKQQIYFLVNGEDQPGLLTT